MKQVVLGESGQTRVPQCPAPDWLSAGGLLGRMWGAERLVVVPTDMADPVLCEGTRNSESSLPYIETADNCLGPREES